MSLIVLAVWVVGSLALLVGGARLMERGGS